MNQTLMPKLTWHELKELDWHFDDNDNIITANAEHIPYIQRMWENRRNTAEMKRLCLELGGTWNDDPLYPGKHHD